VTPAICDGCGKTWQVPASGRTYKCRACGGTVRAAESAPAPAAPPQAEPPATVTCAICKSGNDAAQRSCRECGAPLDASAQSPAAAVAGDQVDARIRAGEVKGAREILQAGRSLFLTNAVLMLLIGGISLMKVPHPIAIGVCGGMAAIFVVAAIRIAREPFVWSVLAASLMTLNFAAYVFSAVVDGFHPLRILWTVLIGSWAASGWVIVTAIARRRQVIAETPGIMKAPPRPARGPHHPRALTERRSVWRTVVPIVLGVGVGVAAWLYEPAGEEPLAPPSLDSGASEFLQAWNATKMPALKQMLPEKTREMLWRQLESIIRRKGWGEALPKVTLLKIEYPGEARAYAVFQSDQGDVETHWRFEQDRWWLHALQIPKR
jgi:hypothetical protein